MLKPSEYQPRTHIDLACGPRAPAGLTPFLLTEQENLNLDAPSVPQIEDSSSSEEDDGDERRPTESAQARRSLLPRTARIFGLGDKGLQVAQPLAAELDEFLDDFEARLELKYNLPVGEIQTGRSSKKRAGAVADDRRRAKRTYDP